MGNKEPQIILFIDWDETITSHDTLSLIAPPDEKHKGRPFSEYGKAYVEDLKQHEKTWQYDENAHGKDEEITIPRQHCNLGEGWKQQWAYQCSLDTIELASQKRIEEGGLFRDADPKELEHRAIDHVQFRKGWSNIKNSGPNIPAFGQSRTRQHWGSWLVPSDGKDRDDSDDRGMRLYWHYHIISVGWSARFISAALRNALNNRKMPTSICANEIELDPNSGLGTGTLTKSYDAQKLANASFRLGEGGIRTGQHKVREMRRILETYPIDLNPITIYVGDSTTDLGCLLEAHIGFMIGQNSSLYNTIIKAGLEKFKVSCTDERIQEIVASQIADNIQPCLIKVEDWEDIGKVLEIVNRLISQF